MKKQHQVSMELLCIVAMLMVMAVCEMVCDYGFAGGAYIVMLIVMYIAVGSGMARLMQFAMSYANPIIIINSLSLLVIFAARPTRFNRVIKFIVKSCFALYLVHNYNSTCIENYINQL